MRRTGVILSLLLAAALFGGNGVSAEPAGNVISLRGKAVIERGEAGRFARVRDAVQEQDTLLTRSRSRMKVLFKNDSVLTLGPKAKLVVRQYLYDAASKRAETLCELTDGKLRAVVGGGSFKVQTPTAYAAARGTVFVIWYDAAGNATGIAVIEGGVEIRNIKHGAERAIILTAGHMSTITGNEGPSPPQPFSIDLQGGDFAPFGPDPEDIAGGGDGGDIPIEGPGDVPPGGGDGGPGDDFPPGVEPPIDQQPVTPVTAPITVQPVFP